MTLPYDRTRLPCQEWGEYVKITVTRAVRMAGYFEVWTREGLMACEDGWLALDSKGNPYPIAADEFERIYRPAGEVYIGPQKRGEPLLDEATWRKYGMRRTDL